MGVCAALQWFGEQPYWIGIEDRRREGRYDWTDGRNWRVGDDAGSGWGFLSCGDAHPDSNRTISNDRRRARIAVVAFTSQ